VFAFKSFCASLLRGISLFAVGCGCLWGAVFLRVFRSNPIRESVTSFLGYKWRAAVEHLLSGVGYPLLLGLLFVVGCVVLCSLSYWGCRYVGWTWKPLAKHPSEVMTLRNLSFVVGVFAVLYMCASLGWELNQAYGDVYKGPRRGYVQLEQVSADMLGAVLSVVLSKFSRRERADDR